MRIKTILFIIISSIFLVPLTSCQHSTEEFTESISTTTYERLRDKIKKSNKNFDHEYNNILKDRLAIFIVKSPNIPDEIYNNVLSSIETQISKTGFYKKIIPQKKMDEFFMNNPKANQLKDLYLDSLVTVAVSNMDILNPLGKSLNAGNILVFHFNLWPCVECSNKDIIRIKVKLVDSETGYVFWTGINEKIDLKLPLDSSNKIEKKLTKELMENFYHRFKKKWHKMRIVNLANTHN